MPVFDFACNACGHKFSVLITLKEKETTQCPACGSRDIRQMYNWSGYVKPVGGSGSNCNRFT